MNPHGECDPGNRAPAELSGLWAPGNHAYSRTTRIGPQKDAYSSARAPLPRLQRGVGVPVDTQLGKELGGEAAAVAEDVTVEPELEADAGDVVGSFALRPGRMSSSTTTKTRAQPFAGRSTVRASVSQQMEQSELVRAEGVEGQRIDGLV